MRGDAGGFELSSVEHAVGRATGGGGIVGGRARGEFDLVRELMHFLVS